ncbi:MAG: hypothetical protein RL205_940 [Actinomycetota bacterium]|jgi:hypothetical protein
MGIARGRVIALAAVALMSLTAIPAQADTDVDSSSSTAAREAATVTVPVRTMGGLRALTGHSGSILIRIGRSAPIRVALDTGFTGLVLIPGAWPSVPSGVQLSKSTSTTSLGNGQSVKGFPGKGIISINGVHGVVPVPFVYTSSDSAFFKSLASTGVSGLMGIGLKGSNTMSNALQSLPGELGLRWSLHYDMTATKNSPKRGALVLGALPPTNPTMAFQMPPNGVDANGAKLWNDHAVPACWTFGRMPEMCLPTLFDSEFTVLRATGIAGRGLQTDVDGDLRYATRVSLAAPGSAFAGWSYLSGQRASVNRTQVFKHGKPAVIAGNMVFFDFTVSYNAATGRLSLSNPTRKAAS